MTLYLAHAGEGAAWQGLLTLMSAGFLVVFLLVLLGRVTLQTPGDLTLPIASVAVLASLAPIGGDPLSDAAPWAVPGGAVLLLSLIVLAVRDGQPRPTSPIVIATVVVAVAASLAFAPLLVDAWYPPTAQSDLVAES
jgi:hypothetical protein